MRASHESAALRLVLRFCAGTVVGSGDGPDGTFGVFGMYGPTSGRFALLLTSTDGSTADYEGTATGHGIIGTWQDERGRAGGFIFWPAERDLTPCGM